MRNYLLMMLLSGGLIFSLASCNDDDDGADPQLGGPTISVTPETISKTPGSTVEFTITTKAATGATVASVSANDDVVSGGTYSYTVPADAEVGSTIEIVFEVADDQEPAKTASTTATITVSEIEGKEITVTGITEDTEWTANNTYILDGFVYVDNDATLTIAAGTTIKAKSTPSTETGDNTTALIITRGARIMAQGTAEAPIVFTTDKDADLIDPDNDNALWGGVAILGNASISSEGATELQVEGIPGDEPRAYYGGTNDSDNSGILQYVSIRFTGAELSPGNEIQGLTLAGVGSGTTIDHIEIFASSDDGIEFFGGTVTVTHAAVAFAEDDSFDWDLGFKGNGQFWFAIQKADIADHVIEADGAVPDAAPLFSQPNIYNATFVGSGVSPENALNQIGIILRDGTGGTIANSIVTDFQNRTLQVEDLAAAKGLDSYQRLINGELVLAGNLFNTGGKTTMDASETGIIQVTEGGEYPDATELGSHLTNNNNMVLDPMLRGISRTTDGGLDPVPTATEATENLTAVPDGFEEVNYKGAFDPEGTSWLAGWSFLSQQGYLAE